MLFFKDSSVYIGSTNNLAERFAFYRYKLGIRRKYNDTGKTLVEFSINLWDQNEKLFNLPLLFYSISHNYKSSLEEELLVSQIIFLECLLINLLDKKKRILN